VSRRPSALVACGTCGKVHPQHGVVLGQPVCQACHQRFRYHVQDCPRCAQPRVLAFYDDTGQPACARCTANPVIYACPQCGREDHFYGARCGRCTLADRLTALLADTSGQVHPQLAGVHAALLAARHPRSTLTWLNRSSGPPILRQMALGQIPISHAAFETMPVNKTTNYLRDLLTALEVLPAYHAELERVGPWLTDLLTTLPKDHADVIARFARWHVLRRLREQARTGRATHGAIQNGRAAIVAAGRYLSWLAQQQTTLAHASQDDLDRYLLTHPSRRSTVGPFIGWAHEHALTSAPRPPVRNPPPPQVTLSDQDRWAHVQTLLHDDSIRLYSRVAGLLTLLFAQPLARILRMRTDQVTTTPDGRVAVTFDTVPIELPAPLDRLVREQLSRPGQAGYVSQPDRWLFPGGIPGNHLATENVRSQLVARGIQPSSARKAAMFHLAAQMPTPVLAEMLGLATNTAVRWAALAASDWSRYTADRRDDLRQ